MGFCLFVRREVFDVIGGLDERFGIGNYEDDDVSLRARKAGFRLRIAGDVFVHHYGSRTFAARAEGYDDVLERNRRLFDEKWRAEGIRAEERKGGAFGRLPSETE
jgi:GT2 family glycosyltransferase